MISPRFALVALGFLLSLRLAATTVVPPDLDSLISQSDYVVRVVVKSATPEWRTSDEGKPYISTKLGLEVREVIKGTPPSPLVIDLLGGRIGDQELIVTGMPVFHVGDESILFVHDESKKMFPLVAMMHGVYPVLRSAKTGRDFVVRSNGMPLYSPTDVSLPIDSPSALLKQNPNAQPLTSKAFIQELRQRVAAGQRRYHEN